MDLLGKRIGSFSFNARRKFVGVALLPCALSVANYALDWGVFGAHSKAAIVLAFTALFLTMRFVGPTAADIHAYRKSAGRR